MNLTTRTKLLALVSLVPLVANCASAPPPEPQPVIEEMAIEETVEVPTPPQVVVPSFYDGDIKVETVSSEGNTTEYKVGDLYVIHRKTDNEVVSAQLYIAGGTQSYPADKAGIEQLAGTLATEGGTTKTPRDAFNDQLSQTGSSIGSFAGPDWSGYSFRSVVSAFQPTWDLFTQAVLTPAMPESEFTKQKAQMLASISTRLDNPDTQVSYEAKQLMFAGQPYANVQSGQTDTVNSLTLDEVKAFQQKQLDASKMLLVVVGKIPEDQLLNAIKSSFGKLKGTGDGNPPKLDELPPVSSKPNSYKLFKRQLPTYYVIGLTTAPPATSPDYYPMLLANAYLSNKLFEEIRTKRNMTYAVDAGVMVHHQNVAYLYVTAVKPADTLKEMYKVVEQVNRTPITDAELTATRNTYITRIYMGLENNRQQARLLASKFFLTGKWQEADKIVEHLNAVTPADIQRVANQYLHGYRFVVVGPTDDLPAELFNTSDLSTATTENNGAAAAPEAPKTDATGAATK